jgi:hypothetical protein
MISLELILKAVFLGLMFMVFHEAGHYYVMWSFGWKPRITFFRNGFLSAVGVIGEKQMFKLETAGDLVDLYKKLVYNWIAGTVTGNVWIALCLIFRFLPVDSAYPVLIMSCYYGFFEVFYLIDKIEIEVSKDES